MHDEHRSDEQAQADENAGQVAQRLEDEQAPAEAQPAPGRAQGAAAREDAKVVREGDVK